MNHPDKEWQEQIEQRLEKDEERIGHLERQQTEPIQITVERRYPDRELLQEISKKQDEHAKLLLAHSRSVSALQTDVSTLKTDMEGVKADIKAIRESQADFRDTLQTTATKDDITSVRGDMANKDDIARLEGLILQLLQQKPPQS